MTNKNKLDKMMRVDLDFDKQLSDIKIERIKQGFDNRFKSDRRLTRAIIRHPDFTRMKDDIIRSELPENLE